MTVMNMIIKIDHHGVGCLSSCLDSCECWVVIKNIFCTQDSSASGFITMFDPKLSTFT